MLDNNISKQKLALLEQIRKKLQEAGFNTSIKEGSVCVYRQVFDRYANTEFALASAIGCIYRNETRCEVYCVEQYDKNRMLRKFCVKLNNAHGVTIKQWDLDTKRGLHSHEFHNNEKQPRHIQIDGGLNNVLDEITKEVKVIY